MSVNSTLDIIIFAATPNAGETTESKAESIPTYGGVHFLRFGEGGIKVTHFVGIYNKN